MMMLLEKSSSVCCNLVVYGLEALRLLLKHWRVAVVEPEYEERTSHPTQGVVYSEMLIL